MRGHGNRQRQGALRTPLLGLRHAAQDRGLVAGDHHLAGRIEIDRLQHLALGRLGTHGAYPGVIQAEDRRHGAHSLRHRGLHGLSAQAHEANGGGEVDSAGTGEGGVFAQTMTRHERGYGTATRQPEAIERHPGGKHGRLGVHCLIKHVRGARGHQIPEIEAQHGGGLGESVAQQRLVAISGHHGHRLRALAGEYECEFHCVS